MASFFSLGSLTSNAAEQGGVGDVSGASRGGGNNLPTQQGNTADPETSWLLYRNQEITYKGLELWHQQQQQTMQQQQQQEQQRINPSDLYASAVRLGVGPSSSTRNISAADHNNNNNSDDQDNNNNNPAGGLGVRSGGSVSGGYNLMMRGSGGAVNCQDCGNQAKKDCIHMRCRTCCKSRGFHCPTHVKSTWVPASKRRERLQQQQAEQQQPKRHRDHHRHHASSSAPPAATTTHSAGMEYHNFPSEVSTEALFRCVRVSPIIEDDNNQEQQFAYQTAINIGGHTFKGILYDQGPADHQSRYNPRGSGGGDSSSGTGEAPPQPLNLISSAPTNTVVTSSSLVTPAIGSSPIAFLDPSLYPASMSSFLAGTQFFPNTRSP